MREGAVVRRVDSQGRLVLPMELRERMGMGPGALLLFLPTEDGAVHVERLNVGCVICGATDPRRIRRFRGKPVCLECLREVGGAGSAPR